MGPGFESPLGHQKNPRATMVLGFLMSDGGTNLLVTSKASYLPHDAIIYPWICRFERVRSSYDLWILEPSLCCTWFDNSLTHTTYNIYDISPIWYIAAPGQDAPARRNFFAVQDICAQLYRFLAVSAMNVQVFGCLGHECTGFWSHGNMQKNIAIIYSNYSKSLVLMQYLPIMATYISCL